MMSTSQRATPTSKTNGNATYAVTLFLSSRVSMFPFMYTEVMFEITYTDT